jgi:hypothetical protein
MTEEHSNSNTKSTDTTVIPQCTSTKLQQRFPEWRKKWDNVSWKSVREMPKQAYEWSKEKMITAGKKIYRKEEKAN